MIDILRFVKRSNEVENLSFKNSTFYDVEMFWGIGLLKFLYIYIYIYIYIYDIIYIAGYIYIYIYIYIYMIIYRGTRANKQQTKHVHVPT